MKKRILSLLLITAVITATFFGCASDEKNKNTSDATKKITENDAETLPTTTKVVLNEVAHSIFYAPMYVAIEEGYFEEEGIELELITGFGVRQLVQDTL